MTGIRTDTRTVTTAQGVVAGARHQGAVVFRGIPYAAPPARTGRFAAPAPHAPWDGVRDTTAAGPTAPQAERNLGGIDMSPYFGPGWVPGDDYLTLDIWTPDRQGLDQAALPVMVFVHGGGFVAGSIRARLYDGTAFARDGVVLVTVGYRLGIAGFLDLPGAPRNRGLLDVLAALRWVRENIAGFGGDPDRVTLFGQSAGATLTGAVVAAPESRGLVQRAIVQSGSGLGAFSPEQAARVTEAAAACLGIAPRADAFEAVPDAHLVEATSRLGGLDLRTSTAYDPLIGLSPFGVVADRQPADAVAAGLGSTDIDLLIGTNAEEGNLYLVPSGAYAASTMADVHAAAERSHPAPDLLVAAYRAAHPRGGPRAVALRRHGRRAVRRGKLGPGRCPRRPLIRRHLQLSVRLALRCRRRTARRHPHDGAPLRLRPRPGPAVRPRGLVGPQRTSARPGTPHARRLDPLRPHR